MKNISTKTCGQRLQMLRQQRNLTQEQMGEKLSLSTSAYCKMEYGETDLTLTRLARIADVFGLSRLELFKFLTESDKDASTLDKELDALRELAKANSRTVELLCRRVEALERVLSV